MAGGEGSLSQGPVSNCGEVAIQKGNKGSNKADQVGARSQLSGQDSVTLYILFIANEKKHMSLHNTRLGCVTAIIHLFLRSSWPNLYLCGGQPRL